MINMKDVLSYSSSLSSQLTSKHFIIQVNYWFSWAWIPLIKNLSNKWTNLKILQKLIISPQRIYFYGAWGNRREGHYYCNLVDWILWWNGNFLSSVSAWPGNLLAFWKITVCSKQNKSVLLVCWVFLLHFSLLYFT